MTRFIGVDLAWGEGTASRAPNETGLVVLDESGHILDAGWTRGVDETVEWLASVATTGSVTAIDAPLVVTNSTGMRECEREVANGYMRWKVGANASNTSRGWQAGVALRSRLEADGFTYLDGLTPATNEARSFFECYPYTTLVGWRSSAMTSNVPATSASFPGSRPRGRERSARSSATSCSVGCYG
jgi:predicted RNase H-like nuclease